MLSASADERSDGSGGEFPDTRCRCHKNARVEYKTERKSRSTAAVDSGGDRAVERKASSQLGASSGVDTRFAENKRAEFDLRDLREHSHEVPWDVDKT